MCFESPACIVPLVSVLKTPTETKVGHECRELILDLVQNLLQGNDLVIKTLSNPAYDLFLTILKIIEILKFGFYIAVQVIKILLMNILNLNNF